MTLERLKKAPIAKYAAYAGMVLFGWLIGYFIRWNPESKRPYVKDMNKRDVDIRRTNTKTSEAKAA